MTTPGGWSPTSGYMLPAGVGASGGTGLSGFAGTTEADWRAWVESQHAPHWDGLGDPIEVMKALVNAVVSALKGNFQPFIDLIGEVPILGDIVKGAANFLSGGRLINLGQLTAAPVNLIAGGFDSLDSVAEAEGWSWDPSDGYGSPGCAMRTLDGEPGLLFSPVAAEVEEGKTYDASCRMKGVDVFPSGASVRFYDADHQHIGTAGLAAVEGLSPGWCLIAASDIPAPTGARWAYFVLEDHGSAGPGELRWDDAGIWSAQTTLPQQIIAGLTDALEGLSDWIETLVDQLLGSLGVPALGGLFDKISDLADEIDTWRGDTEARAGQLADLIGDLLANPEGRLGMIPQGKIAGLADTLANLAANFGGLLDALTGNYIGPDTALSGIQSWAEQLGDDISEALDGIEGATTAAVNAVIAGMNNAGTYAAAIMAAINAAINQTIENIFGDGGTKWGQEVLVASGPVTTGPNDIPLGFGMPFSGKITDLSFYSSDHLSTGSGSKLTVEVRKNGTSIRSEDWSGGTNSKNVTGLNLSVAKYDRITFWVTTASSRAANMSVSVMGTYV